MYKVCILLRRNKFWKPNYNLMGAIVAKICKISTIVFLFLDTYLNCFIIFFNLFEQWNATKTSRWLSHHAAATSVPVQTRNSREPFGTPQRVTLQWRTSACTCAIANARLWRRQTRMATSWSRACVWRRATWPSSSFPDTRPSSVLILQTPIVTATSSLMEKCHL